MTEFTSPEAFEEAYETLFKTFDTGRTKDIAWRKWQLKQCWWMVVENEGAIEGALRADLNRGKFESISFDIRGLKSDILDFLENLDKWAADEKPDAGFIFTTLGKARIR